MLFEWEEAAARKLEYSDLKIIQLFRLSYRSILLVFVWYVIYLFLSSKETALANLHYCFLSMNTKLVLRETA